MKKHYFISFIVFGLIAYRIKTVESVPEFEDLPADAAGKTMQNTQAAGEQNQDAINEQEQITDQTDDEPDVGKDENDAITRSSVHAEKEETKVKQKKVINLVERGINFLNENPLDEACRMFTHSKKFVEGELFLFVFDIDGNLLAHGVDSPLVWKNLIDLQDAFNTFIVREAIKKAQAGGGWITFEWLNATRNAYVKLVEKEGSSYIVGSGYYSHSKADEVVNLVRGASSLFKEQVNKGIDPDKIFSLFTYPLGDFVLGDLYLFAIKFDGTIMAHGERPGLVGGNTLDYRDATGKSVVRDTIKELKRVHKGVWIEYVSKNAKKRVYAEKVSDQEGNNYYVACGYYPEADRVMAQELFRKGYQYMKANGLSAAVEEFTDRRKKEFKLGDLYLFVYNMEGKCLAHGGNIDQVGQNHYNRQDQSGKYYVQEVLRVAKEGGGWVSAKIKNSFANMYVEQINLGLEEYVLGVPLYPISRHESMVLLARSAAEYFNAEPRELALAEFTTRAGKFSRGDFNIFVFDEHGTCYAYGDDTDLVWRNLMHLKDDEGRQFIKLMINKARRGPIEVRYKLNGAEKITFVVPVEKDGKKYIVGSGYYR